MTYGLIADNIDTSLIGMSLLTSVIYVSGGANYSFTRNPFANILTWFITQRADVAASDVIAFPTISYGIANGNFNVSISGGGTPCTIYFFVR